VRAVAASALALSALITFTVVAVDRGAMLLNFRDGSSRLLLWLTPAVDLTAAVPSLFQRDVKTVAIEGLAWLLAAAVVLAIARTGAAARLARDRQHAALGACVLVAVMAAASVGWRIHGSSALTSDGGAMAWLRAYDGDARQVALSLAPFRRIRRADVPPRLLLVDAAPVADAPLADVRHVPAATYEVDLTLARGAAGRLTVSLDRALVPAWTFDVGGMHTWRRELVVPVAAPALIVDGDRALRASIDRVTLRAIAASGSQHRVANVEADHAARYGRALMFLLGGHAFMEPDGVWVQGRASADFALTPEDGHPLSLVVRTTPVANLVTFDGDGWHQVIPFAAGETKTIDVPVTRFRVAVAAGARPVDFERDSTDARFLGVWLEPR
jgi:hypothetical protein